MKPQHGWPACLQDYRDVMAGKDPPVALTPDEYWSRLSSNERTVLHHALGGLLHVDTCELITTLFIRFVALEPEKAQLLRIARGGYDMWPSEEYLDSCMRSWVSHLDKAQG
jgi:hypothetical protein